MNYKQFMPGKVTAADYKFVEAYIVKHMTEGDKTITNPWTDESAVVNPLIGALYQMIDELQRAAYPGGEQIYKKYGLTARNWVSKFDRARYLILKLDQEIYMNFID